MRYSFLLGLALTVSGCGSNASTAPAASENASVPNASGSAEAFAEACLAAYNWEQPMCACAAERAAAELSSEGFAFLLATMEGDEAEAQSLGAELTPQEAMQAGMFMTNVGGECAASLEGEAAS